MSPARRLACFVGGLGLILALLEGAMRWQPGLFEAAAHRALAKAFMFDQHKNVSLLFLGTSRSQDGVSPPLVTRALKELAPELGNQPGFNAAFTGSSLDALASLTPRFASRQGLRFAVIELSGPQTSNGAALLDEDTSDDPGVEGQLSRIASAAKLVRYRKAFVPENFTRLAKMLLFGASLSGWETETRDQWNSWRGKPEAAAEKFDPGLWTPEILDSHGEAQKLSRKNEAICQQLVALAQSYADHGIPLAFAVPPLTAKWKANSESKSLPLLFSEVARRTGCEVWNYSARPIPENFFSNPSHLGPKGRAHYSAALAVQLARRLKSS
jgi:hypothetical protein